MTIWEKAWYYVTRKKEKSMVVVVILMTMMVLLSTVLTMQMVETLKQPEVGQGIQQLYETVDIEAAKTVAEGSKTMQSLLQMMVMILMIMSVVVLSCLLIFRIRERKYEIGIMISIGQRKSEIVTQLIVEMLYLMAIAFIPALILSVGLMVILGYGIYMICLFKAIAIWMGSVMIALIISAMGIMRKNAKTILVQID